MAEYALRTPAPVAVGAAIPFDTTIVRGGCQIRHRNGSGIVRIRGGNCCRPYLYHIMFNGTVTGVAAAITLGIYVDGELLPETLMAVVPAAAADVISVSANTEILADCPCENISVRVIGGNPVTVNTASLIIHRED